MFIRCEVSSSLMLTVVSLFVRQTSALSNLVFIWAFPFLLYKGLDFPLDFCPGAGVEPTSRACSTIELSEYMRGGAAAPPGYRKRWMVI